VQYLEQAVARDSSFSRAWSALADSYILVTPYAGGSPADTWLKAQLAASKALHLNSTSAEAYTSLGYGNMIYAWDWKAAEENFKRAIAADPNYPTGHQWYGDYLASRGRLTESLAEMGLAHQLDPLSRQIGIEWGWVSYLLGRNEEAETRIRQVIQLDPNYAQAYVRLGMVQIQERRYSEAISSIQHGINLDPLNPYAAAALAFAYGVSGGREAALQIIGDLKRRHANKEHIPPFAIAAGYAGLDDVSHGLEWLNRGIDERDIYIPENFFDPLLDPLRSDPRFEQVLKRMGLEPSSERDRRADHPCWDSSGTFLPSPSCHSP
jgi:tetratricopeptide (TPR) repeat protein